MTIFKFSNEKNIENNFISEHDQRILDNIIKDHPEKKISELGFLLISGGLDMQIKVWDFDLKENPSQLIHS